jgi:CubicO group peptidase (beta-lactamase class C family)
MKKTHAISAVMLACIWCLPLTVWAADPLPRAKPEEVGMSSERLTLIGKALNAETASGQFPGGVLAVARRGKLVYFEAFGYSDKAAGIPMTTDSIFSIASMTKPMVAVAALQLYEQGRLSMDDPLSKYFPKFADMQVAILDSKQESIVERVPTARKITIQDLLRHTSGLSYGRWWPGAHAPITRPDTLMQDRKPTARRKPLATHGRTIHWVTSRGLGLTLRRQVDPRQRTPPAARMASGSGQNLPLALHPSHW